MKKLRGVLVLFLCAVMLLSGCTQNGDESKDVSGVNSSETSVPEQKEFDTVFRFIVASDIHVGSASSTEASRLKSLFEETYISDIVGRHNIRNRSELEELLNILSSAIGSLTNPTKLSATFKSVKQKTISNSTIKRYIDYLCDSFLIDSAVRYDIKGKKYIDTPVKYYFTDLGLRNARLNFRQLEETHTMENIIFNELKIRGFNVDVGVITQNTTNEKGHGIRRQLEIDFVCNKGSKRYYIQSAYAIPDQTKMKQEQRSLMLTGDFFKKIIITKDAPAPYYNDDGVLVMGIYDFMLNERSLDL